MTTSVMFAGRYAFIKELENSGSLLNDSYALISINDTVKEEKIIHDAVSKNGVTSNIISVIFQDTDDSDCISLEQAKQISQFVFDNEGKTFIVHCFAGISRSAAVAKFIDEYYDIKDPVLENYTIYNKMVKQKLDTLAYRLSIHDYYAELELQERIREYDRTSPNTD